MYLICNCNIDPSTGSTSSQTSDPKCSNINRHGEYRAQACVCLLYTCYGRNIHNGTSSNGTRYAIPRGWFDDVHRALSFRTGARSSQSSAVGERGCTASAARCQILPRDKCFRIKRR